MTEPVTTAPPSFPMLWQGPFQPPAGYADLRSAGGMARVTLYDGRVVWAAVRQHEARTLLADPRLSADKSSPHFPRFAPVDEREQQNRTFDIMDPPDHTVIRRMLVGDFTANRMAKLRPMIERTANELVDEVLRQGPPADLKQLVALPMASISICHLLGVPYEDHEFFESQVHRMSVVGDKDIVVDALGQLYKYVDELVTRKEKEPTDDLLGRLVVEQLRTGGLPRSEVTSIALVLLMSGHVTTSLMISLGMFTLMQHPDQFEQVRSDPTLIPGAVEELLRYLPIGEIFHGRFAKEDIEIGEHVIKAGEGVLFLSGVINRDDELFPDADRLDIHRNSRHHLTFGYGVHQCIGQNLARAEIETTFEVLLRRLPGMRLAVPAEELMGTALLIPDVPSLPVTWDTAG
jgi:pentalenic acid synthase